MRSVQMQGRNGVISFFFSFAFWSKRIFYYSDLNRKNLLPIYQADNTTIFRIYNVACAHLHYFN